MKGLLNSRILVFRLDHEFMDQSHTQARGTFKYMALEVIDSRKYSFKADFYSLGKIVDEPFIFDTEPYVKFLI